MNPEWNERSERRDTRDVHACTYTHGARGLVYRDTRGSSTWLSLSRLFYLPNVSRTSRRFLESPRSLARSLDTDSDTELPCVLRRLSASTPIHSDRSQDDAMRKRILAIAPHANGTRGALRPRDSQLRRRAILHLEFFHNRQRSSGKFFSTSPRDN